MAQTTRILKGWKRGETLSEAEAIARAQQALDLPVFDKALATARLHELVSVGWLEFPGPARENYRRAEKDPDLGPQQRVQRVEEWVPAHTAVHRVVIDGVEHVLPVEVPEVRRVRSETVHSA